MSIALPGPARGWRLAEHATAHTPVLRLRRWMTVMLVADFLVATASATVGHLVRFGQESAAVLGVPYLVLVLVGPLAWLAMLAATGSYDRRFFTSGAEIFKRVYRGGLTLLAGAALASFLLHADLSRGFVAVAIPSMTAGSLAVRYAARKAMHNRLAAGATVHRMLVIGAKHEVDSLVEHVGRATFAGYAVVATCVLGPHQGAGDELHDELEGLDVITKRLAVDAIAVAGTSTMPRGELRRLAWSLEGENIELIVVPAVTDFAGPRIVVRPVDGLPLLHIDEPELSGFRRQAKGFVERLVAAVGLVAISPLFLLIALRVKLHDGGPVFFRQKRVGRLGEEFGMLKFRTMAVDAEAQLADIADQNEHIGKLFKIRQDPRVTRPGRWLRRHSLDELPQLINVVRGDMALVGPRPPLPNEVEQFGSDMRRRLLVTPGMTGLWQINGRSDLPWEETVRLDLHYVENWSLAMDLLVLWKTLAVVVQGKGGY